MHHNDCSNELAFEWINRLSPAQLAVARTVQEQGLVGRVINGTGFAWLHAGELLVTSGPHVTFSEAFDQAVHLLPAEYAPLRRL